MICTVKCKGGIMIKLPEGVVLERGATAPCPQACPQRNSFCAGKTVMTVSHSKKQEASAIRPNARFVEYSSGECAALHFGSSPASVEKTMPAPTAKAGGGASRTATAPSGQTKPTSSAHEATPARITPSGQATRSGYAVGGSFRPSSGSGYAQGGSFGASARPRAEAGDTREPMRPSLERKYIEIGGRLFSDDPEVRRSRRAGHLAEAMETVFSHWQIRAVFTGTTLKDSFVWLLTKTQNRIFYREEFDAILGERSYTDQQKFFYIFYDIVFRHRPDRGFFWCDGTVSIEPLTSYFRDRSDFTRKYCEPGARGEQFRSFYRANRREILHYLHIEDEDTFFRDMTLLSAREFGELVWIDRGSGSLPIFFGQVRSFIEKMKNGSTTEEMESMIAFLMKYRVTEQVLEPRGAAHPFARSEREGRVEDDAMYLAAGLCESSLFASEYNARVTLLREYVNTFRPARVNIGELSLTQQNLSAEIERLVLEFCEALYGEVDDVLFSEVKGRVWLVKSLLEREILPTFPIENRGRINDLLSLVASPSVERYLALFPSPSFRFGEDRYTAGEYIDVALGESDRIEEINARFERDRIISAYLAERTRHTKGSELEKLLSKYTEQYKAFLKP